MMKLSKLLKPLSVFLGLTSTAFFIFDYFFFAKLRSKMVGFEAVSPAEEGLMNWVGVGLLIFLVFCLLSLWQIAGYLKKAKKITFFPLFLIASGVLSLLFVFSDVALLGDIGKQYRQGLAQPEWSILSLVMLLQFVTGVAFIFFYFLGFKRENQVEYVAKDSNIFLVVQYVGVICGLMGLSLSSMGFLFPRARSLAVHTTISSVILLTPYALVVAYWFLIKFQEKARQWYDEKQLSDVGKSAFLTLVISVVFMIMLFVVNYHNLGGVISILWLPLYLFLVLLSFSLANLYFFGRE